jgi:hypothetical protein
MYLVSVLTLPFAAVVFVLLWLTGWPPGRQVAVGIPVIALYSALALSVSRGVWAAVEYLTDVRTGETRRADYGTKAFRR